MQQRDAARSFEVVGPVTRLVQALRVDILELRRPVLGEQIELRDGGMAVFLRAAGIMEGR